MIAIIDYGMGNLRSVQKGFEKVGYQAEIVSKPEAILSARGVVLPGVGAFGDAMHNLRAAGLIEAIHQVVDLGKPFLGICLGLQLMFEESEEWGLHKGLALFPGRVKRFAPGLKIPHMGWNQIEIKQPVPILEGVPDKPAFYFVHSYYVDAGVDVTVARTEYGIPFTSIAGRDKVYGIQFHPEKSSNMGLQILKNFGGLVSC